MFFPFANSQGSWDQEAGGSYSLLSTDYIPGTRLDDFVERLVSSSPK